MTVDQERRRRRAAHAVRERAQQVAGDLTPFVQDAGMFDTAEDRLASAMHLQAMALVHMAEILVVSCERRHERMMEQAKAGGVATAGA